MIAYPVWIAPTVQYTIHMYFAILNLVEKVTVAQIVLGRLENNYRHAISSRN